MDKKLERRSFLGRLSLGLGGLLALPFASAGKNKNEHQKNEDMDPVITVRPLGFQWDTADPFLFCVHHEDDFPKGNDQMGPETDYLKGRHLGDDFIIKDGFRMYHGKTVPGFPGHPHRGFETITVVRKGLVDHADSMGAAGRYGNGDVQWMTAGKGVQHAEMFPLLEKDEPNPCELFQIWLNLPAKNKMVEPHFKMLWQEDIPIYKSKDSNGKTIEVEVIAGSLADKTAITPPPNSWAADNNNAVAVWNITLQAGAEWTIPKTLPGVNRIIYFYMGNSLNVAGRSVKNYHMVQLKSDIDVLLQNSDTEARILMLQGRPINEQVMQYGPFVMNTKDEIKQAFEDYHATQFGGWPWPKYDQVHPRDKGRFAKHADGKEETRS
jgi:redox-sensitive bicupin YhaK (pirin superfamily)